MADRWCSPCVVLLPTLEEKVVGLKGKVAYAKINIEEVKLVAVKLGIRTVPYILVFNKGKQVDSMTTYTSNT